MGDESQDTLTSQVEAFLGAWFRTRQSVMEANFHRAHQQGLSATQFMLLNLVEGDGPWTLRALATALNLEPTTLTQTVDSLEQRGLVERRRATEDRRRTYVSLTDAGRAAQHASREQFHTRLAAIFAAMRPEERVALVLGLEAFANAALATPSGAPPPPQEEPPHARHDTEPTD